MSAVPGVEEVFSVSSEGSSSVRVTFAWGTDLDAAANDIRDRLDRVIPRLPDDVDRPMLRKFDPAMMPILLIGALSNLDPIQTRRIIDEQIIYRLERVPGVASVDVWGGHEREIQVNLDADKVKALGLPLDLIISGIREGNVDLPAGVIERGNYEILIRIPGVFTSLEQIRDTVVAVRDGVPVRLKEIAEIEDTFRKITRIVRVNGVPGTRLAVNKQSGKNTVEVAAGVLKEIERIREDLPQIQLIPVRDSSEYIKRSIANVSTTAVYGGLLAVLVLLFFLGSIRSTLVIATAIPISIIATFALIYFGGFTLNIMTLGGLALGVGMLVDNSIVVLENIFRLKDEGASPMQAALDGTHEVTAAIVASTLTTLAVFLPMVFVRGIAGIMFKQLAFVVSFSLICSLVVALTLVPMLSSRLLGPARAPRSKLEKWKVRAVASIRRYLTALENGYKRLLHWALDHRLKVLAGRGRAARRQHRPDRAGGQRVHAGHRRGRGAGERGDGGRHAPGGHGREVQGHHRHRAPRGAGDGQHRGEHRRRRLALGLAHRQHHHQAGPASQRSRSSEEIAMDLRRNLQGIPGTTIRTRAGGGFILHGRRRRRGTGAGGGPRLRPGEERRPGTAGEEGRRGRARRHRRPPQPRPGQPRGTAGHRPQGGRRHEAVGEPDRRHAGDRALRNPGQQLPRGRRRVPHPGQGQGRRENDHGRHPGPDPDQQRRPAGQPAQRRRRQGAQRPAAHRAPRPRARPDHLRRDRGPRPGLHPGRHPLRPAPRPHSPRLRRHLHRRLRGAAEGVPRTAGQPHPGPAAGLHGHGLQFESVRDPFVVMFSVPLAVIGVVWMLLLTGTTFNVQSYIGCIMLGGIVVNNAILLVDHTNLLRRRDGMAVREAIEEAGRRRLRPILMTALTTILAMLPLAIGLAEGSEAQAPLARAVVGGLMSSTLITLVVVPVVYSLFEGKKDGK